MLELKNIVKNYKLTDTEINVLKGVSVQFRNNEFIAILGQSGCGKTTLLNIIGGLDKYTSGDLIINGRSTKNFSDGDWDLYRNRSVGFVFQSYNLIPHLSVLGNVELSLTLSGYAKEERIAKAKLALEKVGLADQMNKRPNQLSGGQMQRVAIARAIVNDPDIILADEPTGALDSESGIQVMEILREIAREKLVIMVTHNSELARDYSTRTVKLHDGVIISDSAPYFAEGNRSDAPTEPKKSSINIAERRRKRKENNKITMSFKTSISLSARNLWNKKGRTFLTSFAGSIGIIGILLVMAMSNGAKTYLRAMEENSLSQYPLTIAESSMDISSVMQLLGGNDDKLESYPDSENIYINKVLGNVLTNLDKLSGKNDLEALKKHLDETFDDSLGYFKYDYGTAMNVYCNYVGGEQYMKVNPFLEALDETLGALAGNLEQYAAMLDVWDEMLDDTELLKQQYDIIGNGRFPTSKDEVVIVLDEKNRLDDFTLFALGLKAPSDILGAVSGNKDFFNIQYTVDELMNLEYKIMTNADYYYMDADNQWKKNASRTRDIEFVESNSITVKVVGVIRPRKDAVATSINGVIGYTKALSEHLITRAANHPAVLAQQLSADKNIVTGEALTESSLNDLLHEMGVANINKPSAISIYAYSFEAKDSIIEYLENYNKTGSSPVQYTDRLALIMSYANTMTNTVTGVLGGFSGISLIVSSIMIAIITYTSVLERIKEIGVLRSLGARKRDVSSVFLAESAIIGIFAGLIGVLLSFIITFPTNILIEHLLGVANLVSIEWWNALLMLGISLLLSVVAGFIPSRIAAKKDPVLALRSE